MAIMFRKSVSDPYATDIGNKVIQGKTVSKTVQFSLFTTNENAVWAARNLLRKEAYPFASISVKVNRKLFKLQVGDVFKLNNSAYSISGMVCRVLLVEEENSESEDITLHVMEDIYSRTVAPEVYTAATSLTITPTSFTPVAFTDFIVIEAPYVLSQGVAVVPMASRSSSMDNGFLVFMSVDDGASYSQISAQSNIVPFGELTAEYPLTNPVDTTVGMLVDFATTDISTVDSITFALALSGNNNLLIDDEIISFQTITPVSGTIYNLTNIIRARYGTQQAVHSDGADVWFIKKNVGVVTHAEIASGVTRQFKLVPYTQQQTGSVSDASEFELIISGKSKTPYTPANFAANSASFASRYSSDIVLTWSAKKRGSGAGIGTPGVILAESDHEGLFSVEVYVASSLVRTTNDIDALTWTYTSAMNISDNGSLATEIEFKLTNYLSDGGYVYTSDSTEVTTKLTV